MSVVVERGIADETTEAEGKFTSLDEAVIEQGVGLIEVERELVMIEA